MAEFERVNITVPKKLLKDSKALIDEGLYSSFSDLVRQSIKNEVLLDSSLIGKKRILNKWFKEEEGKGFDSSVLSHEDLIGRIRTTRDELWAEKYKQWFEGI